MGVRKFWLINSNPDTLNNRYDFTDEKSIAFLSNPAGLGFSRTLGLSRLGDAEVIDYETINMEDFTGSIVFRSNTEDNYEEYRRFISFIRFKPLELHYLTPNMGSGDAKYCKVSITSLSKGEADQNGTLVCDASFHRLTQWLDEKETQLQFGNVDGDDVGKYYDLTRDYHYAGATLDDIQITNEGTNDASFIFEIDGEISNPVLTLYQNDIKYGVLKINGTYGYVMVNSYDDEQCIYLEDTSGTAIPNPSSFQDLSVADGSSYVTWLKLKVGTTNIRFTSGNIATFDGTVKVRFRKTYVSI